MKRLFLTAILGAIILFVWSAISWMALPWHRGEMNLYNTTPVINQNTTTTKVQIDIDAKNLTGKATISQAKPTQPSMWLSLLAQFIVQYIAAWLVALMLFTAKLPHYWHRVGFVVLFGVAAGVICYFPHSIWFRIPIYYTVVNLFDSVIGWFLAGLGLAWLIKKPKPTSAL